MNDEEIVPPHYSPPKSKRSLQFLTPKADKNKSEHVVLVDEGGSIEATHPDNTLSSPEFELEYVKNRKRLQSSPGMEEDEVDGFIISNCK